MTRRGVALLLGLSFAGCGREGVKVIVTASSEVPRLVELRVRLDLVDAAPERTVALLTVPLAGAPATIPPERSFRLRLPATDPDGKPISPASAIELSVVALDGEGHEVARGSGSRQLHIGDSGEVLVQLGPRLVDGGQDGPLVDLPPPPDLGVRDAAGELGMPDLGAPDLAMRDLAMADLAMADLARPPDYAAPRDLAVVPDLARTVDLAAATPDLVAASPDLVAASPDLARRLDLALPPPDTALRPDLSIGADFALPVDFSRPSDFASPADLAIPPDLVRPPDLAIPLDRAVPPDLSLPPDLAPSCGDGAASDGAPACG